MDVGAERVVIRKLEKGDLSKGFIETLSHLFKVGLSPEEAEELYEHIHGNPVYRIFVAELDGEIVGAATLLVEQKFLLKGAKFAYLEDMAVREGFERKGIGKQLVQAAIEEAKREGCFVVRLDCDEKTASFYEKSGGFKRKNVLRMQITLRHINL